MKCEYCNSNAIMHLELELGKTLNLCVYHWQKLKEVISNSSTPLLPPPIKPIPYYPIYPVPIYPSPIWWSNENNQKGEGNWKCGNTKKWQRSREGNVAFRRGTGAEIPTQKHGESSGVSSEKPQAKRTKRTQTGKIFPKHRTPRWQSEKQKEGQRVHRFPEQSDWIRVLILWILIQNSWLPNRQFQW